MDFDEYEALPTSSTATHMLAGSAAGIMEHCVMYPVDSVKTRMQSLQPNPKADYRNFPEGLYKMIRYEGVFRPVRGMSAVVTGAGPAHALYFACYEKLKRLLSNTEHGNGHPLAQAIAGGLASICHDIVMNPAEVVKQRMQMFNSPYKSVCDCVHNVWRIEGIRAFYRSYSTQLMMNVPFQSIHFVTYEFIQDLTNHERKYNPKAHVISGAIAGAFSAAVTTPLDVCKTLLNTQEKQTLFLTKQSHINGFLNAVVTIYKFRGFRGYFQGLPARVVYQMPATAISWSVYEFFKYFLNKNHIKEHSLSEYDHMTKATKSDEIQSKLI